MIFLVVDYNYDLLLRLHFLMKIGVVVDVEKRIILEGSTSTEQFRCYNGSFASSHCEYVIASYKARRSIPRQIQQPKFGTSTYMKNKNP
jgi:hypothetical protein